MTPDSGNASSPLSDPSRKPAKKPFWRRALRWMLRGAVVLIVLAIAAYAVASYWAAQTIHAEIAKIRAAHGPLTIADLDKLIPHVKPEEDAGRLYRAAAALALDFDRDRIPGYDEAMKTGKASPEFFAAAQRIVQDNKEPLELLDRGAGLPGCNDSVDLQYGVAAALPRMGHLRGVANICSLRTRTLALQGNPAEAAQSLDHELGFLRVFERQPVLLTGLVHTAVLKLDCKDLAILLAYGKPTDETLAALDGVFAKVTPLSPRAVMVAERVLFLEIVGTAITGPRELVAGEGASPPLPESQAMSNSGLTGRIMAAKGLQTYRQMIGDLGAGWEETTIRTLNKMSGDPDPSRDPWLILASSQAKATMNLSHEVVCVRTARLAIAVERYRLVHAGKLPDTLEALPNVEKDVLTDPHTGKPFHFEKLPDQYCIYSDGPAASRGKELPTWIDQWGIRISTEGR